MVSKVNRRVEEIQEVFDRNNEELEEMIGRILSNSREVTPEIEPVTKKKGEKSSKTSLPIFTIG